MVNPADPSHSDYLISTNGLKAEPVHYAPEPLFDNTISELLEQLDTHYNERCGFITGEEQEIVTVENIHENKRNNFYMCEESAEKAIKYIYEKTGQNIMGIWHTHPNGYPWPSPRDIRGWPKPALNWRYFLVSRGAVTEWRLVDD